jgi:hypothetical protein
MLSEYEVSILTRFRQYGRASGARSLGPKPAAIGLGVTLVAIVSLAASAWLEAAEPDSPIAATGAVLAQSRGTDAGALRTGSRKSERVEFFFDFLEFDWDANKPGGVPGFAS